MKIRSFVLANVTAAVLMLGCADSSSDPTEGDPTETSSAGLLEKVSVDTSRGHANLHWALVDVPASVAQSLLPAELRLASQPLTDAGRYRIGIALGRHQNVRMVADVFGLMKWNYDEFFLFLPAVEFKGKDPCARSHDGTFAFMPNLYLDDLTPTVIGWIYGLHKELATFRTSGDATTIRQLGHSRLAGTAGPDSDADDTVATDFLRVASGSNPFGTVTVLGKSKLGLYQFADLRWNVGSIVTHSADVRFRFDRSFGQLGPGTFDVAGIGDGGTGFHMEYDWTLKSPVACIGL